MDTNQTLKIMRTTESIFREIESVPDFTEHKIDSIDYKNGYGDTPLHIVSYWGDCEAISILVAAGANLNAIGESGFTPLHCAAQMNKANAVELLLQLGAGVVLSDLGESPITLAEALNYEEVINAFNRFNN
jgi:uncharacterized protein